jgi:hypothetical protein
MVGKLASSTKDKKENLSETFCDWQWIAKTNRQMICKILIEVTTKTARHDMNQKV